MSPIVFREVNQFLQVSRKRRKSPIYFVGNGAKSARAVLVSCTRQIAKQVRDCLKGSFVDSVKFTVLVVLEYGVAFGVEVRDLE